MVSASSAARITQRGTFYKAQDLNTGRYVRFPRDPQRAPTLTTRYLCTWFPTHQLAAETISARMGACAVEIERHDS